MCCTPWPTLGFDSNGRFNAPSGFRMVRPSAKLLLTSFNSLRTPVIPSVALRLAKPTAMRSRGTCCLGAAHEDPLLHRLHHRQQIARDLHRNDERPQSASVRAQDRISRGIHQAVSAAIAWCITNPFDDVTKAIDREKQLKRWSRRKKVWLIVRRNPTWEDLAAEWFTRHMYEPEKQVPPLA